MIQVSLIKPSQGLIRLADLPSNGWNKGVIQLNMSELHQLKIEINPYAGDVYDILKNDSDAGLRITATEGVETYFDYAFVKQNGGREAQEENQILSLTLNSYSVVTNDVADGERVIRWGTIYNRQSLNAILGDLSRPNLLYKNISDDLNISVDTGFDTEYDFFNRMIKKHAVGYNWVDTGIQTISGVDTSVIEVADYDSLVANRFATNRNMIQSPFENEVIMIDDLEINYSGEQLLGVLPIGTIGEGANLNSSFFITNPANINSIPGFPVIPSPTKTANGKTVYYVANTLATAGRVLTKPYDVAGENQQAGIVTFNDANIENFIYQLAVQDLKRKQDRAAYKFSINTRKPILVGDRVEYDYHKEIEFQGRYSTSQSVAETQTIKKTTLNLVDYA